MLNFLYQYFIPQTKEELKDFYYLSLIKEQDSSFSIHGLWPQTTIDNYPTYCKKVDFDINTLLPIMNELKINWYSTMEKNEDFWKHEWEKHGSCTWTEMNELEYFSNALNLFEEAKKLNLCNRYFNPKTNKCLIPINKNLNFINS